MRLHVVYSQDGEILAAVQLDLESPVRARPIPDQGKGHQVADVYVPTNTVTTIWALFAPSSGFMARPIRRS
jgi:hypothetical protein